MKISIADLRKEYALAGLRRADLLPDPILQFDKWLQEAVDALVLEPTAMTCATADKRGVPSARTVLLKEINPEGFVFFTNYESRKGRELADNPKCALTIYWKELERQVCIAGEASRVSREISQKYFQSRPVGSQLAAWVSQQTTAIENRGVLEKKLAEVTEKFSGGDIPLAPYWGGYVVAPERIEFWQGRPNRLHDRFLYTKEPEKVWRIERLAP